MTRSLLARPLALVAVALLAAGGCGGAPKSPAPSDASSASQPATGGRGAKGEAVPDGNDKGTEAAPTSPAIGGQAKPGGPGGGGSAMSAGDPGAAAGGSGGPGTDRVEQMKVNKTKSAGGQYGVSVVSASGTPSDEVGKALVNTTAKTDVCYANLFKKQLGASGKTAFDIVISAKGKTQSVKLRSDDTKNADLVKCLEGVIKAVEWTAPADKAGGKTTVEWYVEGN